MANTGTREQLAARIVNDQEATHPAKLAISGIDGNWSVLVEGHPPSGYTMLWLASTRKTTEIRSFKTLDAAYRAAAEIATLADPTARFAHVTVTVEINR